MTLTHFPLKKLMEFIGNNKKIFISKTWLKGGLKVYNVALKMFQMDSFGVCYISYLLRTIIYPLQNKKQWT